MAAAISGNFVVTSPNQVLIWKTPQETVYLRSDCRYGPHDPTLLPQPYVSEYPYLGSIPSKPMDDNDPLSIMWWNPTRGDFLSSTGGVIDGIGKLRRARYDYFLEMTKHLEERIRSYCANNANNERRSSFYNILHLLERDLLNASSRLDSLPMSFNQMVFQVTEFQRCYLETRGLLDYLEVYWPRMVGKLEAATTVAKCVGATTSNPHVVQEFFTAGLPVWFIRPLQSGPFPHNVLNVVPSFEHADWVCVDNADPPFPVIYDGPLTDGEKHNALHRFSRKWLAFKDPFQHQLLITSEASTNTRASTSSVSPSSVARGPHCKMHLFLSIDPFSYPSSSLEASTSPTSASWRP